MYFNFIITNHILDHILDFFSTFHSFFDIISISIFLSLQPSIMNLSYSIPSSFTLLNLSTLFIFFRLILKNFIKLSSLEKNSKQILDSLFMHSQVSDFRFDSRHFSISSFSHVFLHPDDFESALNGARIKLSEVD